MFLFHKQVVIKNCTGHLCSLKDFAPLGSSPSTVETQMNLKHTSKATCSVKSTKCTRGSERSEWAWPCSIRKISKQNNWGEVFQEEEWVWTEGRQGSVYLGIMTKSNSFGVYYGGGGAWREYWGNGISGDSLEQAFISSLWTVVTKERMEKHGWKGFLRSSEATWSIQT